MQLSTPVSMLYTAWTVPSSWWKKCLQCRETVKTRRLNATTLHSLCKTVGRTVQVKWRTSDTPEWATLTKWDDGNQTRPEKWKQQTIQQKTGRNKERRRGEWKRAQHTSFPLVYHAGSGRAQEANKEQGNKHPWAELSDRMVLFFLLCSYLATVDFSR